ncbi:MAG: AzlD domain-containing protein [Pararhodobacter sp.]
MTYSELQIWIIILAIGIGTLALRFSFLGIVGKRALPEWALRHLRYTPVAVIPGLMAPAVVFPPATEGETDPVRLAIVALTVAVGIWTRNAVLAMIAGGAGLVAMAMLRGF